jgi:hypothetical protein
LKRLLPFVFLILLVLAGILAVPFLLRPESHRQEITDTLSKLLKRPVVIGPMSVGYLPPTLRLEQVSVMGDGGNPILQVGSAAAPLDWAALFHLKMAPQEVEMSRWTLTITRKLDGTWDIEDYLPGTSGLSGAKAWPLRRVHWKEGEIHWVDRYASVPQELVLTSVEGQWDPRPETIDLQGTFTGIASGVRAAFSAKGQFFTSQQWAGDLQLTDQSNSAAFHVSDTAGAFEIKGQSARWNLANALSFLKFYGRGQAAAVDSSMPIALENWQWHAKAQQAHLSFEHSASIAGGLSEIKGTLDRVPFGIAAHAEIATKDVPAEALLNLVGEKIPLDGKVTLVVKNFDAILSSATLSTIKSEGYGELKDGVYHLPNVSWNKLAKAKTMAYIKKKFPDLAEKGFPVLKLSAHWSAKNGIATVDDGKMLSTDIKAAWVGKMDLAREGMDGYLRLQIHEKDPAKLRLIPEKYHDAPAYGKLQGTWSEWSLKAVPASKIPTAIRSKLGKAVQGK